MLNYNWNSGTKPIIGAKVMLKNEDILADNLAVRLDVISAVLFGLWVVLCLVG
jgi:uncharacterized membrane protein YccF (DUF307 family)